MRAFLVVLIILVLLGTFIYFFFSRLLPPFDHTAIEKDFVASIPTIFRTPGGNLELAGVSATETFMSSDTAKLPYFNLNIPGATTTVIITVPVIYRYYIPLREQWDIKIVGSTCLIYAPTLRPVLPPAIQSEKMAIKTFEGPLAFDGAEQQAKLLQSLSPQLEANAKDSTKIKFVREEARQTVAEFVRDWLLQRGEWGQKKVEKIDVFFRGENELPAKLAIPPAETTSARKE